MPPSGSEQARSSSAFHLLHPGLQRWIWGQGWGALHAVQEAAIPAVLEGRDVLISAGTSGGKTEAAFLPVLTRAAAAGPGLKVLNLSPLRALINDQHRRLEGMGEAVGLPVHRWHGDVGAGERRRLLSDPSGVLVMTPESLEAMFVLRGSAMPALFGGLDYVVIDELHAFIGAERGQQVLSLLHRVEAAARRSVPRVAMSATLGDPALAAELLRPGGGARVVQVQGDEESQAIKLIIRGYLRKAPQRPAPPGQGILREPDAQDEDPTGDEIAISQALYRTLRGGKHLIFANSRIAVERTADLLRRRCEAERVPVEFFAHHGSLARALREEAELRLRDSTLPATVVCTSTLELGIDVGDVESVAQLGAPSSVASLRQRLGRSGRRDDRPSILRTYVTEPELHVDSDPEDQLRIGLVAAVATVRLLLRRWVEPPPAGQLHLSTLLHQILSLIAQHGGVSAGEAWRLLCATGPFRLVNASMFASLLRELGRRDLITQLGDGSLTLGLSGERIVNHYSFYAVFQTPEEWRLVTGSRPLGTIPLHTPLLEGQHLIFAGRPWRVRSVEPERRLVDVSPAPGGRAVRFGGQAAPLHTQIAREMFQVLSTTEAPVFLDPGARGLLAEARDSFQRLGLADRSWVEEKGGTRLFPWVGSAGLTALELVARRLAWKVERGWVSLFVEGRGAEEVLRGLREAAGLVSDAAALLEGAENLARNRYDDLLPEELLRADYASSEVDLSALMTLGERDALG